LSAEQTRKLIVIAAIWITLLLAPYWMVPLGGYTALATRVLVLGLAAMSVNFRRLWGPPRHPHRAAAWRLLRHGDDRVRASVLLHRVSVELVDRR
jgi:hypothetical protein